jgi:methionyl-tRNA formyltransferase
VVSYGQILPRTVLEIPHRGSLNVHASLLPRYRGAAPAAWAIIRGERETGVTTMVMTEGLDAGPILLQSRTPIGPEETQGQLLDRLATLGASLLVSTLEQLDALVPAPQDEAEATRAPLLKKEDGRIHWEWDAPTIVRRIRGLDPWPGTFTAQGGHTLKILRGRAVPGGGEAGTVVGLSEGGFLVACGGGTRLEVLHVQPESRGAMGAADYVRGARLLPGARLG